MISINTYYSWSSTRCITYILRRTLNSIFCVTFFLSKIQPLLPSISASPDMYHFFYCDINRAFKIKVLWKLRISHQVTSIDHILPLRGDISDESNLLLPVRIKTWISVICVLSRQEALWKVCMQMYFHKDSDKQSVGVIGIHISAWLGRPLLHAWYLYRYLFAKFYVLVSDTPVWKCPTSARQDYF